MSYHLEMEKTGKPKIEMPPLPEEPKAQQEVLQQQVKAQPKEEQQYDVHPDIANEYNQQEEPVEQEATQEEKEPVQVSPEQSKPKNTELDPSNLRKIIKEKAEKAERAERERDELLRKIEQLEAAKQNVQAKIEQPEESISDDDLIHAGYLKKYDKKIRELEEKFQNTEKANSIHSIDARLKAKYPDMDSIVSQENLEVLKSVYPEIAESIKSTPDLYSKAVTAYTLIKKLGIATEDNYVEDKQKAQKNAAKPRPMASISPQQGDSPLSKANAFANGLTDDLKAQLRREMEDARRNM